MRRHTFLLFVYDVNFRHFTINFNRNRVKISYITSAAINFPVKTFKCDANVNVLRCFFPCFPSLVLLYSLFNAFSLYSCVLHSIGHGWSMCTAFVDNKTLGGFYVDAYAKVGTLKGIRRIRFNGITGKRYAIAFWLCRCRFSWFIFSRATAVQRRGLRHFCARTSIVEFYVTFFRCCYVRCRWKEILAWKIQPNSSLNVSHIFFLTQFQIRQIIFFSIVRLLMWQIELWYFFFFSKFSCHVFAQLSLFIDEFCAHFLRSSILSFISNSFSRIVQISNFSPQFMKIRYFSEFSTIFIHFRIYSDVLWDVTNENNIINKHFVSVNESLRTNSQDSLQLRKISSKKSQFSLERLEQFRTKAIPWP